MAMDTMSVLGLYRINPDLFLELDLPNDLIPQKNLIVNNILMECAEVEILYTDPHFMQWAIGQWSEKELSVWNHLFETTKYEYDPIYNYDRNETYHDSNYTKIKTSPASVLTVTQNGSNVGSSYSNGYNTMDNTENEFEYGYEEDDMVNRYKKTNIGQSTNSVNGNTSNTISNTTTSTNSGNDVSEKWEDNERKKFHAYGNIGVTSTQELIEQERNIAKFNVIDYIIQSFKDRFCIMIY